MKFKQREAQMEELLKEILETLKQSKVNKVTFSIMEAAMYSGIGHEKIRELVNRPNTDFPYFKVGSRVAIDKRVFDEWLDKITLEHRKL